MKHIFPKYLFYLILIFETTYYFGSGLSDWFWKVCADSLCFTKNWSFSYFLNFFFFQKIGPKMLDHEGKEVPGNRGYKCVLYFLLHSFWNHCDPCNPISSHQCNLFMNHTIFCSKLHLFPSHRKTLSKTQQPIRCQGLFMVTNQIRGLRKKDNFCNF